MNDRERCAFGAEFMRIWCDSILIGRNLLFHVRRCPVEGPPGWRWGNRGLLHDVVEYAAKRWRDPDAGIGDGMHEKHRSRG